MQKAGKFDTIQGNRQKVMGLSFGKEDYIAVFDSGLGGLSVLGQLHRLMPRERYLYFGDSANAPYGSRPTDQVRQLTLAALESLTAAYPVKAIVIACNTATAAAVEQVRAAYPSTIVVGIEPALKLAADRFPAGHIGVMATEVTLREKKFEALLHSIDSRCTVWKIPAPGLVEHIEAGDLDSPQLLSLLETILGPYAGRLDTLVLGCTHYPFAAGAIQRILGPQVTLLDGGEGTARETHRRLEAAGLLAPETAQGQVTLLNSSQDPQMIPRAMGLWKGR